MRSELLTQWDPAAGIAGAPRFAGGPPLAFDSGAPSIVPALAGALIIFLAVRLFARVPSRGRWLLLSGAIALAVLGARPAYLVLLGVAALLSVIRSTRGRPDAPLIWAGTLAAVAAAAMLSAPWWLPAVSLSSARSNDVRFNSRWLAALKPIVTTPAGTWRHTPLAQFAAAREPRFFGAGRYTTSKGEDDEREILRALRDPDRTALVDHVPSKIAQMSGGAIAAAGRWHATARAAVGPATVRGARWSMHVDAAGWTLLVTNRPWWPGWRVYWNGQRMPPVRVDGAFVGTFVPPGSATVEFRYRPDTLDVGLRTSAFGAVVVLLLVVFPLYRRAGLWWAPVDRWLHALPSPDRPRRAAIRALQGVVAAVARQGARLLTTTVIALVVVYAAVLLTHRVRVAGGSDSSGYLNEGRLWSVGELIVPIELARQLDVPRQLDGDFAPLGFVAGPRPHTMVPSYPPGLPLHLAAARIVGGEEAPFVVGPIAALAAVLLLYALARDFALPRVWSAAVAAALALCPVFLFHAVQPVSDVMATTWALAAIVLARRAPRSLRWAAGAGLAFGIGVLVRPTNAMLFPAFLVATDVLRFGGGRDAERPKPRSAETAVRTLAAIALGGLVPAIVHFGVNAILYGGPLASGYGDVRALLAWAFFPPRFSHYSYWLAAQLSPLVFPVGLAFIGMRRVPGSERLLLALWFIPFFVFYCFYGPYETWWYTRFLLPAVPALLVGSALALRAVTSDWPARAAGVAAIAVLAVVVAAEAAVTRRFAVLRFARGEETYLRATLGAARLIPADAIVLGMQMSGANYYNTGKVMVRSDHMTPEYFGILRASAGRRPWFALLADFERDDAFRRTGAAWAPVARFGTVGLFRLRENVGRE